MLGHAGVAADAELSVIDIGGGYGVVTEEVVAAFPRARVTLQDYSEPMLLAARERIVAHSGRLNYVLADLTGCGGVDRVLSLGGGPSRSFGNRDPQSMSEAADRWRISWRCERAEARRGVPRLRLLF